MKSYYVYKVTHIETGEFYIGSRGCDCSIFEDSYMGSYYTWKPDIKKLIKEIIATGFNDMENAIEYEREEIIKNISHPLNRNYSIPHPKWNMDGKTVVKDEFNKILVISVNDPLFGKKFHGVTKGLVVVRDEDGNTFQVSVDNPRYKNGELKHVGIMKGKDHPNYNKICINKNDKQKFVSENKLDKYINEGWIIGGTLKGKTTPASHVNTVWIHNENESKRIDKKELKEYLSNGWNRGRGTLGKYKLKAKTK